MAQRKSALLESNLRACIHCFEKYRPYPDVHSAVGAVKTKSKDTNRDTHPKRQRDRGKNKLVCFYKPQRKTEEKIYRQREKVGVMKDYFFKKKKLQENKTSVLDF